ncbi:FAD-dependent oxidoreductase [Rhodobacter sp. NTK016B]|uniref:protoporphyrinogen/coproporphyrinogen oxidase n=1 Tax=Rhodobacter sp. NTK016B TaxID=2759676 RepID=UPI001A8C640C|nr:FAD-dependent oxidoreductase [Rhodobacter sp. NTK016B]MBN8290631.1 FAD-dependent oxidoreductase [Rhodobacter sp. NTK016B]
MSDIIVIGAGIAGLTAAYRLSKAGHSVTVLEAGAVPGGRVGDRETRGIRYNAGARLIYPFSKPFNALLDELGLRDQMVPVRKLSAQCIGPDDDWLIELMPGPRSLLTPGLSLAERMGFIALGAKMLLARRRSDPDDAASALAADAQSLAAYTRRHAGPNVLARMVDPVFRGTRAWNAEDISAAFFASTTPHLIGQDSVYVFKQGMATLPEALAHGLDLRCNTRVVSVTISGDGYAVETETGTLRAARVVMAVEGSLVAGLMPDMAAEDRAFFDGVRYNSLGIVHYRLKGDVAPKMNFFAREAAGPIATYQQVPANPAKGQAAQLYAQLSPEANAQAKAEGRTGALHGLIEERVLQLYPTLNADCDDRVEQWIERKLPTFYPGYARAMAAFRDRQSGGLAFCGDYLAQSLLTGASASGERAARQIMATL